MGKRAQVYPRFGADWEEVSANQGGNANYATQVESTSWRSCYHKWTHVDCQRVDEQ
jgi:hypothetical protein